MIAVREAPSGPVESASRWDALTARLVDELGRCEPIYGPTTFWGPGIRTLLDELAAHGLETFKSWPSASEWFYPIYGAGFNPNMVNAVFDTAQRVNPGVGRPWLSASLGGGHQARRDYDAVRLAWDQAGWPFDIVGLGESETGLPPQSFRFNGPSGAATTRPYLNYLLCLAALSRHVEAPPHRFLELGGGFGVLGEIVLSRDPDGVYVNLDLPPLLTVASFYLDRLFGDRLTTYEAVAADGPIQLAGSACLPNWRINDLRAPFDVFCNTYSFQEMEPDVVERYVADVAALGVTWIVSLNSRDGKAVMDTSNPIGVTTPVRSADIRALFEARGYRTVATYGEPLLRSNGELAILRRGDGAAPDVVPSTSASTTASSATTGTTVDLRLTISTPTPTEAAAARRQLRPRPRVGPLRRTLRKALRAARRRL